LCTTGLRYTEWHADHGHPLAAEPERIRQAAGELAARHPSPEPEDVLLWAEARAFPSL